MENKIVLSCLFVLSFSVLLTSCSKDDEKVVAAFTASNTDVDSGETVSFTNQSENAGYYMWNFGDGGLSAEKNPTHTYDVEGDYDVKLVAAGDGGVDSASVSISVTASYDITIYEGKGIKGINIYDSWSTIESAYTSDTICYIYDYTAKYGMYLQYVYYYEEGIVFAFWTETTALSSSDEVYYIFLVSPYDGATSKNISVGSDIDDVISRYGDPETENSGDGYELYGYDSMGIDFYIYTDESDNNVDEIDIYEAYDTSSSYTSEKMKSSSFVLKNKPHFNLFKGKK